MIEFALTLLVFLAALGALAVGVIAGRAPLARRCSESDCIGGGNCGRCPQASTGGRKR